LTVCELRLTKAIRTGRELRFHEALAQSDGELLMRCWIQRLLGRLNAGNIKFVKRVIVSVVGATVLLIDLLYWFCLDPRSW
jgi:hypothetical protein